MSKQKTIHYAVLTTQRGNRKIEKSVPYWKVVVFIFGFALTMYFIGL